jgi:hypothetical protein
MAEKSGGELVCRSGEHRFIPKFSDLPHFAGLKPGGSLPLWTRYMLIEGSTAGFVIYAVSALI